MAGKAKNKGVFEFVRDVLEDLKSAKSAKALNKMKDKAQRELDLMGAKGREGLDEISDSLKESAIEEGKQAIEQSAKTLEKEMEAKKEGKIDEEEPTPVIDRVIDAWNQIEQAYKEAETRKDNLKKGFLGRAFVEQLRAERAPQALIDQLVAVSPTAYTTPSPDPFLDPPFDWSLAAALYDASRGHPIGKEPGLGSYNAEDNYAHRSATKAMDMDVTLAELTQVGVAAYNSAKDLRDLGFSPEAIDELEVDDHLIAGVVANRDKVGSFAPGQYPSTPPTLGYQTPQQRRAARGLRGRATLGQTRAQDATLQRGLAEMLGDARTAQSVWQGTARERNANRSQYAEAIDWANTMLNSRGSVNPNMSYPTTPEVAGVLLDRSAVGRMMSSPAYNNPSHPQHANVTKSVSSWFDATYVDNVPGTPNRNTVAEEPSRMIDLGAVAQARTDQMVAEQNRAAKAAAAAKAREEAAHSANIQAQERAERAQMGLPDLDEEQTIDVAQIDTLGENAISKAQARQEQEALEQNTLSPITRDALSVAQGARQRAQARSKSKVDGPNSTDNNRQNSGVGSAPDYSESRSVDNSKGYTGTDKTAEGSVVTAAGNLQQRARGKARTNDGSPGPNDNSTVICTELHRQGLLEKEVYWADQRFGARLIQNDPHVIAGYHFWAKPVVRLMRRSRLLSWIIFKTLAEPWTQEMSAREGVNGFGTLRGKVLMAVGLPLCRTIGRILAAAQARTEKTV